MVVERVASVCFFLVQSSLVLLVLLVVTRLPHIVAGDVGAVVGRLAVHSRPPACRCPRVSVNALQGRQAFGLPGCSGVPVVLSDHSLSPAKLRARTFTS